MSQSIDSNDLRMLVIQLFEKTIDQTFWSEKSAEHAEQGTLYIFVIKDNPNNTGSMKSYNALLKCDVPQGSNKG